MPYELAVSKLVWTCAGVTGYEHGNRIVDDTLLVLLNAHYESVPFVLPAHRPEQHWELVLDTQESGGRREPSPVLEDDSYVVAPRSLVMVRIKAGN